MRHLLILIMLSAWTIAVMADEQIPPAVTQALARIIPSQQPDNISGTPVAGIFEAAYGPQIVYITADGKFLFDGDLYALDSQHNLTESKRNKGRLKLIQSIDPSTFIAFKPKKPKYIVTVFTDVDCAFCRKLHREINDYLDRGIEIRYASYPRIPVPMTRRSRYGAPRTGKRPSRVPKAVHSRKDAIATTRSTSTWLSPRNSASRARQCWCSLTAQSCRVIWMLHTCNSTWSRSGQNTRTSPLHTPP